MRQSVVDMWKVFITIQLKSTFSIFANINLNIDINLNEYFNQNEFNINIYDSFFKELNNSLKDSIINTSILNKFITLLEKILGSKNFQTSQRNRKFEKTKTLKQEINRVIKEAKEIYKNNDIKILNNFIDLLISCFHKKITEIKNITEYKTYLNKIRKVKLDETEADSLKSSTIILLENIILSCKSKTITLSHEVFITKNSYKNLNDDIFDINGTNLFDISTSHKRKLSAIKSYELKNKRYLKNTDSQPDDRSVIETSSQLEPRAEEDEDENMFYSIIAEDFVKKNSIYTSYTRIFQYVNCKQKLNPPHIEIEKVIKRNIYNAIFYFLFSSNEVNEKDYSYGENSFFYTLKSLSDIKTLRKLSVFVNNLYYSNNMEKSAFFYKYALTIEYLLCNDLHCIKLYFSKNNKKFLNMINSLESDNIALSLKKITEDLLTEVSNLIETFINTLSEQYILGIPNAHVKYNIQNLPTNLEEGNLNNFPEHNNIQNNF